ncbi:MAG: deoxyribodipyrimidine photo-lyase, partial [Gemmatimonadaceae bacterium]
MTKHPLGSPYVRDQLSLRTTPLNEKRLQPEGEYVLYWMQSTQRLDDNWALRLATLEADRIGKPLFVHHDITPDAPYSSARSHTFALQGASELATRAEELGIAYRLALPRRAGEGDALVQHLASRAALVVTDLFPTAHVPERTAKAAAHAWCRLLAVDSVGVVASASFHKEEYAARTIRPRIMKLLELALEPVEDRIARKRMPAAVLASLDAGWLEPRRMDLADEVARCAVD